MAQKTKRPTRDDPEQSRLFVKKAREIGADEDRSAADDLLGVLHKKPPQPHPKPEKARRRSTR
jgi:hypothetical protein